MTFISISLLEERRSQGISPQGGPAPLEAWSKALELPNESKLAKLDALLALQWNHPGDDAVMARIFELIGHEHSRAEVLTAAGYVRNMQTGKECGEIEHSAYSRLIASI